MWNVRSHPVLFASSGRVAENSSIESLDGSTKKNLPHLLACNNIPDNREEIPTPEIAHHYPHCLDIQIHSTTYRGQHSFINCLEPCLALSASYTLPEIWIEQRTLCPKVTIGMDHETCLGKVNKTRVSMNNTFVLDNERPTMFQPCENTIHVAERWSSIGSSAFARSKDDNKVTSSLSMEDKKFMQVMDRSFH